MKTRDLVKHVGHFQHRVVADALQEATAAYWRKRAEDFRQVGTAECDEVARACENRARVALDGDIEEFYEQLWDAP